VLSSTTSKLLYTDRATCALSSPTFVIIPLIRLYINLSRRFCSGANTKASSGAHTLHLQCHLFCLHAPKFVMIVFDYSTRFYTYLSDIFSSYHIVMVKCSCSHLHRQSRRRFCSWANTKASSGAHTLHLQGHLFCLHAPTFVMIVFYYSPLHLLNTYSWRSSLHLHH